MRITARIGLVASLVGMQLVASASVALAGINGQNSQDGISTVVTSQQLERAKKGMDLQTGEPDKRVWEYTSVTTCPNNVPGGPNADLPCLGAIQACAGNTPQQGQGPQIQLFRREVDAANVPMGGWQPIRNNLLPAAGARQTGVGDGPDPRGVPQHRLGPAQRAHPARRQRHPRHPAHLFRGEMAGPRIPEI